MLIIALRNWVTIPDHEGRVVTDTSLLVHGRHNELQLVLLNEGNERLLNLLLHGRLLINAERLLLQ